MKPVEYFGKDVKVGDSAKEMYEKIKDRDCIVMLYKGGGGSLYFEVMPLK